MGSELKSLDEGVTNLTVRLLPKAGIGSHAAELDHVGSWVGAGAHWQTFRMFRQFRRLEIT